MRWSIRSAFVTAVLLAAAASARSDMEPGADWHLAHAAVVLLVHTPSADEKKNLPPDLGNVLIVDSVVKGSDTRRYIPVVGDAQPAGSRAMVLLHFRDGPYSAVATQAMAGPDKDADELWPLTREADLPIVHANVSLKTGGGFGGKGDNQEPGIFLDTLRGVIAPEELSLHTQMLDELFFSDRFAGLEQRDPARARFVRMNAALRDLARDVPSLAALLESPDPALRRAVAAYLQKLTHAEIPVPSADDDVALHGHVDAWYQWWIAHANALVWDEASAAFVARPKGAAAARWPAVPPLLDVPPNLPLEALIQSLQADHGTPDSSAFAAACRAFMDAGVLRDRALWEAMQVVWNYPEGAPFPPHPAWCAQIAADANVPLYSDSDDPRETPEAILIHLSFANSLFGGSGPYLPPAPRLRPDILLNPEIPAKMRALVVLNMMRYLHCESFRAQRFVALQTYIAPVPVPDHDLLRRAAFWEPFQDYPEVNTIAGVAATALQFSADPADRKFLLDLVDHRPHGKPMVEAAAGVLQKSGTPADQKHLAAIFLADPNSGSAGPAYYAAKAGQAEFIHAVLAGLATSTGESFRRQGEILASAKVEAVNPVLAARLNDPDAKTREFAARNLCVNFTQNTADSVLTAWARETDPAVREQLLLALSQVLDPKALDLLLAAAKDASPDGLTALAQALRRFNDPKALPVLAQIVMNHRADQNRLQALNESVIAFGAISGLYPVPRPQTVFGRTHNIEPNTISAAVPIIEQWVKDHP